MEAKEPADAHTHTWISVTVHHMRTITDSSIHKCILYYIYVSGSSAWLICLWVTNNQAEANTQKQLRTTLEVKLLIKEN